MPEPRCPPGLRAYRTMMEVDRAARLADRQRLRGLVRQHGEEVRLLCAHDPVEFSGERPQARQPTAP